MSVVDKGFEGEEGFDYKVMRVFFGMMKMFSIMILEGVNKTLYICQHS